MKNILLFITFMIIPHSAFCNEKTVILLGQWHLLSSTKTLNTAESTKLLQYPNQKAIYLILRDWIEKKQLRTVLAEGCEGEINKSFNSRFNGWGYEQLAKVSKTNKYDDLLTHIPLKIEALFNKEVDSYCVDDLELIKRHQVLFSDIKAYSSFYLKLTNSKESSDTYRLFTKGLEEIEKKKIVKPIKYLKLKISTLLIKESKLLELRNENIVKSIMKIKSSKMALVIGYRHVAHLSKLLKDSGIEVIVPAVLSSTLPENDFIADFKKALKI